MQTYKMANFLRDGNLTFLRHGCFIFLHTDTPPRHQRGVLPSSSPLARCGLARTRRGGLSRSVLPLLREARFRMPYGTVYCLCQNVDGGVVISIEYQSTAGTDMRSDRERLLDPCATGATILCGVRWLYRNHRDVMHLPIVGEP